MNSFQQIALIAYIAFLIAAFGLGVVVWMVGILNQLSPERLGPSYGGQASPDTVLVRLVAGY